MLRIQPLSQESIHTSAQRIGGSEIYNGMPGFTWLPFTKELVTLIL